MANGRSDPAQYVSNIGAHDHLSPLPNTQRRRNSTMSFQAYLDAIEERTALTPRQFIALAHERGLDTPPVQARLIIDWLKTDYGLGRGHAMALVHVIKNGPKISDEHIRTEGTHRDESDELWVDGKNNRPT